jgi:hypothetical protein
MPTRIIFNGRAYDSPEAMPEDVRSAYQEMLGREHLAGRLTVATTAFLLLGWLDTQATRLARRRQPLLGPDSAGYRRFVVLSSSGLLLATALLFGLASFLR